MFSQTRPGLLRTFSTLVKQKPKNTLFQNAFFALARRNISTVIPVAIRYVANDQELKFKKWEKQCDEHHALLQQYYQYSQEQKPDENTLHLCQSNEFSYGNGENPIHKAEADKIINYWIEAAKNMNPNYLIGIGTIAYYVDDKDENGKNYAYNLGVWIESSTGDVMKIYKTAISQLDKWNDIKFNVSPQIAEQPDRLKIFTGPNGKSIAIITQICIEHSNKVGASLIPSDITTFFLVPARGMFPVFQGKPHYALLVDGPQIVNTVHTTGSQYLRKFNQVGNSLPIDIPDDSSSSKTNLIDWILTGLRSFISKPPSNLHPLKENLNVFVGLPIAVNTDEPLPISKGQSLFPDLGSELNYALSSELVLLNGMKVIFDQSTPVYPVNLQPKEK